MKSLGIRRLKGRFDGEGEVTQQTLSTKSEFFQNGSVRFINNDFIFFWLACSCK